MIESIHVFQDQEEEGDGGKDREGLGTVQGKDSNSPSQINPKKVWWKETMTGIIESTKEMFRDSRFLKKKPL